MSQLNFSQLNNLIQERLLTFFPEITNSTAYTRLHSILSENNLCDLPAQHLHKLHELDYDAQVIALLTLSKSIQNTLLNGFRTVQLLYPEATFIGGQKDEFNNFSPTLYTALFLLAPIDTASRISKIRKNFEPGSPLFQQNILKPLGIDPFIEDTLLECTPEFVYHITHGQTYQYGFSENFPASLITPKESWEDLVLTPHQYEKIEELKQTAAYHQKLLQHPGFGHRFKENIIALFSGDPGTGKTLTAGLIGQYLQMPVYKIDLSRIVSKWVGETTKNLRNLFDIAENKGWILFFDEADSIFGKRTQNTGQANEQYFNQDISYLLQRIDTFRGFIILSTNLSTNIDKAFSRRIDQEIVFRIPDKQTRIKLWENAFAKAGLSYTNTPPKHKPTRHDFVAGSWESPDQGINLAELADYWDHATGALINKVMKRLLITSYEQNHTHLPSGVIFKAIYSEMGNPRV
jgi:hypothetical protein